MQQRQVGPFSVSAIGLGCMNIGHGVYGPPPSDEAAVRLLQSALDQGCTFFDTAVLYGFGLSEKLVGQALSHRRSEFTLASKCGLHGVDGKRVVDNSPATLKRNCEDSLKRLRTDVIDLYYLHRYDPKVPIEDSVGALGELVREGKVRTIGLSETSADTLRRAHAVHPITAVQTEYSLWTRNPEIAVLDACRELGAAFVAFSPVARGYLTGRLRDVSTLKPGDLRLSMPRFEPANYDANLKLLDGYVALAAEAGVTPAQLALAWVLAQGDHIVAIPGTSNPDHLAENLRAGDLTVSAPILERAGQLINQQSVHGTRYNTATQASIDTEEFAAQG